MVEFVVDSAAERGARGGEEGTLAMVVVAMVFSSSCSLGSLVAVAEVPIGGNSDFCILLFTN